MTRFRKYIIVFYLTLTMNLGLTTLIANSIVTTLDQVILTAEGIYVNFEGNVMPVDSLSMANDGYVVALPKPQAAICPNCGYDRYTPGRFCPRCNFPDDAKVKHSKNASIR